MNCSCEFQAPNNKFYIILKKVNKSISAKPAALPTLYTGIVFKTFVSTYMYTLTLETFTLTEMVELPELSY